MLFIIAIVMLNAPPINLPRQRYIFKKNLSRTGVGWGGGGVGVADICCKVIHPPQNLPSPPKDNNT